MESTVKDELYSTKDDIELRPSPMTDVKFKSVQCAKRRPRSSQDTTEEDNKNTEDQQEDTYNHEEHEDHEFLEELSYHIALVLDHSCRINDPEVVTPSLDRSEAFFFSSAKLDFSLQDYLLHVMEQTGCSSSVYILALTYMLRAQARNTLLRINSWNVHRMFVACTMIAAKYLEHGVLKNSDFATACCIDGAKEVNVLEKLMLHELGWRLKCDESKFWFVVQCVMCED